MKFRLDDTEDNRSAFNEVNRCIQVGRAFIVYYNKEDKNTYILLTGQEAIDFNLDREKHIYISSGGL
ncbi:hypothetical protein M0R01_03685 [bacterium]|nr:hypothetical protein [bacterium]